MKEVCEIYRGLQKPFCLFGLRGINVLWGLVGGLVSILLFIATYIMIGLLPAVLVFGTSGGYCGYKINYHLKNGLHNKKRMKGIWMAKNLIKPTSRRSFKKYQ